MKKNRKKIRSETTAAEVAGAARGAELRQYSRHPRQKRRPLMLLRVSFRTIGHLPLPDVRHVFFSRVVSLVVSMTVSNVASGVEWYRALGMSLATMCLALHHAPNVSIHLAPPSTP